MSRQVRIIVLFAHLDIRHSKINRAMVDAVRDLPQVDFVDLLETYPDFYIDVPKEQARLREADLLVLQHPVYWYGMPAILKHWHDVVLTRGFAYGEGGTVLHGKQWMQAISTGAPREAYGPGGVHHYPLELFLRPFEQTARFCGMRYLRPFVLQGGRALEEEVIAAHARRYRAYLEDYDPGQPSLPDEVSDHG